MYITVPPQIIRPPNPHDAVEEGTTTFICRVNGTPFPSVRWLRDGIILVMSLNQFEITFRFNKGLILIFSDKNKIQVSNVSRDISFIFRKITTVKSL